MNFPALSPKTTAPTGPRFLLLLTCVMNTIAVAVAADAPLQLNLRSRTATPTGATQVSGLEWIVGWSGISEALPSVGNPNIKATLMKGSGGIWYDLNGKCIGVIRYELLVLWRTWERCCGRMRSDGSARTRKPAGGLALPAVALVWLK